MPCPSHSSRFYHPHNSGWGVKIMELLIMKFSLFDGYAWNLTFQRFSKICWENSGFIKIWRV
jgi:hypothetical protein